MSKDTHTAKKICDGVKMPFIKRESHTISLKQIPSLNPPPGNRSNSIVSKKKTSASTSTSLQPVPQRRNVDYGYKVKEMLGNGIRTFKIFSNVFSSDEIGQLPRLRVIHWRSQAPGIPYVRSIDSNTEVYATLIQSRGVKHQQSPCTSCASGNGPFAHCVTATTSDGKTFGVGACGNCFWTGRACRCSLGRDLRRKRSPSPELPKKRPRLAITAAQSDIHSLNRSANSFKTYLSSIPLSDAEAIREGIKQLQNTRAELDKACDALQSRLSDLEKEEASGWSLYLK